MSDYTRAERRQLAATLECDLSELNRKLRAFEKAAAEEYVRMILGQRVLTRGQDIREYRLALMISHVFGGRLPSEERISALFQTTATQSRALLRAVMSKYQYELQQAIQESLREVVASAIQSGNGGHWLLETDSENLVDALNRAVAKRGATFQQISKSRGSVGAWDIPNATYQELRLMFP
jgi:hypothetical protein